MATCAAATYDGLREIDRTWTNWNGDVTFVAAEYFEPAHSAPDVNDGLAQLVNVVARASDEGRSVHAIGSGWAFEDAAASDDWVVCLKHLNRMIDDVIVPGGALTDDWVRELATGGDRVLVHVEAGIRIADLSERLDERGLAMPTLGGSNGQALAGVVATSTHGGDWQRQPFPDLVRAVHLVTEGGQELWIERETEPVTTDTRLQPLLSCPGVSIRRDDRLFDAVIVACGRFGIVYSFVLEVRRSFRVVEVVTRPARTDVLQALRDGVTAGTLFGPFIAAMSGAAPPSGVTDATGDPSFFQILFNSQNPNDVWVHRRWETQVSRDIPPRPTSGATVTATDSAHDTAVVILQAANVALAAAVATVGAIPIAGPVMALYVSGVQFALNAEVSSRPFTLGSVVTACLTALWRVPAAGHVIPALNGTVINNRLAKAIADGRRGPHHLLTSGSRFDSDDIPYKADSIEVVFDASTSEYLDFLDLLLGAAPAFQQAGYVSLRPSAASRAWLSMHNVPSTHAMSIEVSTLKPLPGNGEWMAFVHRLAVAHHGRPHWGQYNKLDAQDVAALYGPDLHAWREALFEVVGSSPRFSNAFSRARGLEPVAIVRTVTHVRRRKDGVTTRLCNPSAPWSFVTVAQAIRDIRSGAFRYYVEHDDRLVPIDVVGGRYVRSRADDTETDNLDRLPQA